MRPFSISEKRAELRRVLESRYFAKARKKSRFLEFICEQAFQGQADQTSEYLVGVEVYERGENFNPHEDSIVRVQAHEIRKSLNQFYTHEGKESGIRLELPPGHYVPRFSHPGNGKSAPARTGEAPSRQSSSRTAWAVALCFALLSAALGLTLLAGSNGDPAPDADPWSATYSPQMDWFWDPFLSSATPPLVVAPVHPLLRAAHEGDTEKTQSLGFEIDKSALPQFRDTIHYRELQTFRFVPSTTDFTAVGETLGLVRIVELFASQGRRVRVKAARLVDFGEIERNNTILLGGNQAWSGRVFLYREGFWFHEGVISNGNPRDGEQDVYRAEFDPVTNSLRKDYALILMLPNEQREKRIMLAYGIYTQGSQAALEFITSQAGLDELRQALIAEYSGGEAIPSYFQALLETTVENSVPGKTSVVAVRVISDRRDS